MKTTNEEFNKLENLVERLNSSNSTNEKKVILSESQYSDDEFIKSILHYTYNPYKQFRVKPDNLKKNKHLVADTLKYDNLFELLDALDREEITGHNAISHVNKFIEDYSSYTDIIYNIFDRNLKVRMTDKLVNQVIPDLVPTFDVALANEYNEKLKKKINFDREEWFASRKLDGLRCLAIIGPTGDVKLMSRSGKEFKTLDVLKEEISGYNFTDVVLDGEICIVDENGNEDFTAILKEYNKKDHTIKNPKYLVFDFLSIDEFDNKESKNVLSDRYQLLLQNIRNTSKYIDVVFQSQIKNKSDLEVLQDQAATQGWEGLMLRKNTYYKGKRSNDLLKVKTFKDEEYIVKDIEIGPFRTIVNGKEITENILASVFIEHKGYKVRVGSGFSIDERRHYKEHPEDIIGKEITVKYFNESTNKDGGLSLRFPTVKAIYKGKRDI